LSYPASSGEQRVEVQITATAPVNVYVLTEKELEKAENNKPFDRKNALASKEGATNETIQATGAVPTRKSCVVVESAGKKSEVKLTIDGR